MKLVDWSSFYFAQMPCNRRNAYKEYVRRCWKSLKLVDCLATDAYKETVEQIEEILTRETEEVDDEG